MYCETTTYSSHTVPYCETRPSSGCAARTQGCVFLRKNAGRVREIGINLGAQCAPRVFLILILVFFW